MPATCPPIRSVPGGQLADERDAAPLDRREMVILGTNYAGEMKKGVFAGDELLDADAQGSISMHCSADEGPRGNVSLFFGLSGTGKTTLSSDPRRGGSSAMTSMPGATPASSTSRAAATPSASACASGAGSRRSITPSASVPCWRTWYSIPRPGGIPPTMIARSPRIPGRATRSSTSRGASSPAWPGTPTTSSS